MSDHVSRETNNLPSNIARQVEQREAGQRKNVRHGGTLCSRCLKNPPAGPDRYCHDCRKAYSAAHKRRLVREVKRLRAENAALKAQLLKEQPKGHTDGQGKEQARS